MENIIYLASDNTGMTRSDLESWLIYIVRDEYYVGWSFDDLTGGVTEFISPPYYDEMKKRFKQIENELLDC